MEPKILSKGTLLIAGVTGSGDKTGEAWEAFTELDKRIPLKNKAGEEGYEIRLHSGNGPGEVHVGVSVKDAHVPAEYKIFSLPASEYAAFDIYPSKGYSSSNRDIEQWLSDNAEVYSQADLGDRKYALEVYDERYKGEEDPTSVVSLLVPIKKSGMDTPEKKLAGQIEELGGRIEEFAGAELKQRVMEGEEKAASSGDPQKTALWIRDAMNRLDSLVDAETRKRIMNACGHNCHAINSQDTEEARERRRNYATEEEFLEAEITYRPGTGVRYERNGNVLIQYYTPRKFGNGMRCYCYVIGRLPADQTVSPTYCQCSKGFVEKHWEGVLGRPVRVELGETAVSSGTDECKFIIHL